MSLQIKAISLVLTSKWMIWIPKFLKENCSISHARPLQVVIFPNPDEYKVVYKMSVPGLKMT